MSPPTTLLELTAFVREVRQRKDREVATQKATEQARKRAIARQQFRPLVPEVPEPIKLRF